MGIIHGDTFVELMCEELIIQGDSLGGGGLEGGVGVLGGGGGGVGWLGWSLACLGAACDGSALLGWWAVAGVLLMAVSRTLAKMIIQFFMLCDPFFFRA